MVTKRVLKVSWVNRDFRGVVFPFLPYVPKLKDSTFHCFRGSLSSTKNSVVRDEIFLVIPSSFNSVRYTLTV